MLVPDGIAECAPVAGGPTTLQRWPRHAESALPAPRGERWPLPDDADQSLAQDGHARPAPHHDPLHDALTGLPARALFLDRLAQAMQRARRHGGRCMVALLALERAHPAADEARDASNEALLQALAQRLAASLREMDTVARLGPAEFGLLLPGVADAAQAQHTLHKLRAALAPALPAGAAGAGMPLHVGACLSQDAEVDGQAFLARSERALAGARRHAQGACVLREPMEAATLVWDASGTAGEQARPAGSPVHPALQSLLRQLPVVRRLVHAGDRLFRVGERFEGAYVLHAGSVKLLSAAEGGRAQVVAMLLGGDWFGFDGLADGHHDCEAVATDTGEVWLLPHDALLRAGAREPRLLQLLHAEIARAARRDRESRLALTALPVDAKVAAFLCRQARALAERGMRDDQVHLRLSRAELGDYLDMTLESVSRAMTQLARKHLIGFGPEGRRLVLLPDLPALEAFVRSKRRADPAVEEPGTGGDDDEHDRP